MRVDFHPAAQREVEDAQAWYEERSLLAASAFCESFPLRFNGFGINDHVRRALAAKRPVISVDTKKKELLGNYHNAGRQWRPARAPDTVQLHDFPAPSRPAGVPVRHL